MLVSQYAGNRFSTSPTVLQEAPEPSSTTFVSQRLIDTLSGVVNDGLRLGQGARKGTFFVHVEPQGFGGVLSIRYRR